VKYKSLGLFVRFVFGALCVPICVAYAEVPAGFTPLFNGKDLAGWKGQVEDPKTRASMPPKALAAAQKKADKTMRAHWKVVDGVLEFDGKGQNLCTAKDYGNFELWIDWKIHKGGDSGIFLRGSPQIQIWDTAFKDYLQYGSAQGSGAFWNNEKKPRFPLVHADKPPGQWNTFYIRMVGQRATIQLNGQVVVDKVGIGKLLGTRKNNLSDRSDRTAEPWQYALVSQPLYSRNGARRKTERFARAFASLTRDPHLKEGSTFS